MRCELVSRGRCDRKLDVPAETMDVAGHRWEELASADERWFTYSQTLRPTTILRLNPRRACTPTREGARVHRKLMRVGGRGSIEHEGPRSTVYEAVKKRLQWAIKNQISAR